MGRKIKNTWHESLYLPPQLKGRRDKILSRAFAIQNTLIVVKKSVGLDDCIFLLKQFTREYKMARVYRRRVRLAEREMVRAVEERDEERQVVAELARQIEIMKAYLPDTLGMRGELQ